MNSQQFNYSTPLRVSAKTGVFDWVNAYISMLAVIAASVAYLDLAVYYQVLTGGAFLPKYAYFALGAAIAPLFILRNQTLWSYLKTPYVLCTFGLVVLNFAHWLFYAMSDNPDAAGMVLTRIQYFVLAALIGFLLVQARPTLLGWTFVVLALVLTALQMIDFFMPGTVLPKDTLGVVIGRAASTLINANKAAESLVLLAVLGMAVLQPAWRIWLVLMVLPGVFLTFSRSGFLAWSIIVVAGFWFKLFSRSSYIIVLLFTLLVVSAAAGLLEFILSNVDSSGLGNLYHRVMFFSTLDSNDFSAQERLTVAGFAFESFLSQPWFGNGAGYTHFWSFSDQAPHNQHLLILAEYGVAGYVLFIGLIVLMFRGVGYFRSMQSQAMSRVAFAVFLVFTLFSHNLFDHLYWLVTFAFLGQRRMYSSK